MSDRLSSQLVGSILTSSRIEKDLIEQKYIDLSTTFERLMLKSAVGEVFADLVEKLRVLFSAEHCWDNANIIEQLLIPLYSEAELDSEIKLGLFEAQNRLSREISDFFNQEFNDLNALKDPTAKSNLLANIYKKLHISYDLEEQKKHVISKIRFTNSFAFFMSIMIFFSFDNMRLIKQVMAVTTNIKTEFIVTAIAVGWMGACFSMLLRMKGDISQQSLSDLKLVSRLDNLLSRSLIGMVSGLLIFYAFEATFLQGMLFPPLDFDSQGNLIMVENWTINKTHATLVFWTFLGGFSEKMVPDLLAKAETKAVNAE